MIKRLDNVKLPVARSESELLKIASRNLGAPQNTSKFSKNLSMPATRAILYGFIP